MTQKTELLQYLKEHKTIMPMEALSHLGIYRLADTVYQLRAEYDIVTEMVDVETRRGRTAKVAKYHYRGEL